MLLELSIVSYHRLSSRLQAAKQFSRQGGTIGRAETCDWQLADPERFISGIHVAVGTDSKSFYVEDLSTNGLFYNEAGALIGKGNRQYLKLGDTLLLGDYELQVTKIDLVQDVSSSSVEKRLLETSQMGCTLSNDSGSIESINDVLSLNSANSVSTHTTSLTPLSDRNFVESPLDDFFDVNPIIPDDWATDIESDAQFEWAEDSLTRSSSDVVAAGLLQQPSSSVDDTKLRAFSEGLGLSVEQLCLLQESPASWQALGEMLRSSVEGLMQTLRMRSEIKNTLRVNQTTFQPRENNPLKFSSNFEDLFNTLFINKNNGFLSASQAVKSAFSDINNHDSALVEACKVAGGSLLSRLSPESILAKDVGSSVLDKISPAYAKARYWSLYELYHKELSEQLLKNQKRAFNDDFIDAYEQSLKAKE